MNTASGRYLLLDNLRGFAILLMFVYHFSFDLNYYNLIYADFRTDPFWINFRIIIVSMFLGVVGISLVVATQNGVNYNKFFKRFFLILVCALLVTSSSYVMYPDSFIFFGILHFIALASLLGLFFIRFYWINLITGILILAVNLFYSTALFNPKALSWIGLVTRKPVTEDYVPFFPWFGIVLIGMFLGKLLFSAERPSWLPASIYMSKTSSPPVKLVALLGRHSLLVYMIHQPVFFALLYPIYLISR